MDLVFKVPCLLAVKFTLIIFFSLQVIQNILEWFLGHLSDEPVGSTIVDILASNCVQKKFSQTMLEHAYDNTITGEECILLSDDKNVPLDEILNYCFIDDAIRKVTA